MKIRLWGTEDECQEATDCLMRTPGLLVLSVSEPRADRGASVLVRVYIEARLDGPLPADRVASTRTRPARAHRRELPPGGIR